MDPGRKRRCKKGRPGLSGNDEELFLETILAGVFNGAAHFVFVGLLSSNSFSFSKSFVGARQA